MHKGCDLGSGILRVYGWKSGRAGQCFTHQMRVRVNYIPGFLFCSGTDYCGEYLIDDIALSSVTYHL